MMLTHDFVVRPGVVVTAESEVAGMPGSNLRVLQPSVRWRTTTITDTLLTLTADFTAADDPSDILWDTAAIIAYDGAPSRNFLRGPMDGSAWTRVGVTTLLFPDLPPVEVPGRTVEFLASADPAHVTQVFDKPEGGAGTLTVRISIVARSEGPDRDLKVIAASTFGTQEAFRVFDMSAGALGSSGQSGSFVLVSSEITALSGGWFLCRIVATTDSAATLSVRYEIINPDGGSPSGGTIDVVDRPECTLSTSSSAVSEYPTTFAGNSPCVRVFAQDAAGSSIIPTVNSGLDHMASRNWIRGFGQRFSWFYRFSAVTAAPKTRVNLYDRYNANGYIEAGRLIVGRSIKLKGVATAHGLEETGDQTEADGGQLYRPQKRVRRRPEFLLRYSTKAAAYDELQFLRRVQGRSRQVLVIADETDPLHVQEGIVYGYIDDLPPMPVAGGNASWTVPMTIVETP